MRYKLKLFAVHWGLTVLHAMETMAAAFSGFKQEKAYGNGQNEEERRCSYTTFCMTQSVRCPV